MACISRMSVWMSVLLFLFVCCNQVFTKQHYGMHKLNLAPKNTRGSDPKVQTDQGNHDNSPQKASSRVWRHAQVSNEILDMAPENENQYPTGSQAPTTVYSDPEWLHYMKSISEDMKSVKRQLSNIKYENHLLYRQVKRMQTKCGNEVIGGKVKEALTGTSPQSDAPLPDSLPACPKGFLWHKDSHSCYRLESDRITWYAAKDSCQSMGAELVAVETAREQRFLNGEASKRADTRHCDFWTSGTDKHSEGKWYWLANNKPMSYMNWNHNEPNNGGHNEHCMQMLWVFNWAWNDSNCKDQKACYICEIHRKQ